MTRASVGVWALCGVMAAVSVSACGGRDRDAPEGGTAASGDARPEPITATGCLTAQGDRFVLTDLQRAAETEKTAADEAATDTYQLIGADDQLRPHVGQQVRVNGEAEPPAVAEMRESTPATPTAGATGTAGQAQSPQPKQNPENAQQGAAAPQVRTETETRMEVAQLRVQSVTPTGDSCAAETNQERRP